MSVGWVFGAGNTKGKSFSGDGNLSAICIGAEDWVGSGTAVEIVSGIATSGSGVYCGGAVVAVCCTGSFTGKGAAVGEVVAEGSGMSVSEGVEVGSTLSGRQTLIPRESYMQLGLSIT